jgi:hypothetical protein
MAKQHDLIQILRKEKQDTYPTRLVMREAKYRPKFEEMGKMYRPKVKEIRKGDEELNDAQWDMKAIRPVVCCRLRLAEVDLLL